MANLKDNSYHFENASYVYNLQTSIDTGINIGIYRQISDLFIVL
jgi:hypothetical protein